MGDGFLVVLLISTVLNPIAWGIYLSALLLPLAVLGHRLSERSWPLRPTLGWGTLVFLLIFLRAPSDLVIGGARAAAVSTLRGMVTALPMLWPIATSSLLIKA